MTNKEFVFIRSIVSMGDDVMQAREYATRALNLIRRTIKSLYCFFGRKYEEGDG